MEGSGKMVVVAVGVNSQAGIIFALLGATKETKDSNKPVAPGYYYTPSLIGGGIKRCCCLISVCLSDVWRLSVAYIGPKSRTERPKETKIGTEVAHFRRDSDTTFKVKRSKERSLGRFTHRGVYTLGGCSGERGKVFTVGTYCYVAVCRRGGRLGGAKRFGAHRRRRGAAAYRGGRPPTACFLWRRRNEGKYW